MALSVISLTTTWKAITTSDQSGTCWISEYADGLTGSSKVYVHRNTSLPTGDTPLTMSKRVYKPNSNKDVLEITAGVGGADVFYARCVDGTANLVVDAE